MTATRVAVNGYGVIGKRVADDYRVSLAAALNIPLFGSTADAATAMAQSGLAPADTLDDLLGRADIVVYATPKQIGATNKARYDALGVKAISQGGEPHDLTGLSFVAQANYTQALAHPAARVVSCNRTGLVRMFGGGDDSVVTP